MATVDDKTVIEPGIQSGRCNYMQVSDDIVHSGKTVIRFLELGEMTGDHADTAKIVGQVDLHNADLLNLQKMISERLEQLDSVREGVDNEKFEGSLKKVTRKTKPDKPKSHE